MSNTHNKRLLIEIDRHLRSINREAINSAVPELTMDDLNPVLTMVARARTLYLQKMFALANEVDEGMPSSDQIKSLRTLRVIYEELVSASQAMEAAIERGYLDVQNDLSAEGTEKS